MRGRWQKYYFAKSAAGRALPATGSCARTYKHNHK